MYFQGGNLFASASTLDRIEPQEPLPGFGLDLVGMILLFIMERLHNQELLNYSVVVFHVMLTIVRVSTMLVGQLVLLKVQLVKICTIKRLLR